MPKPRNTVESKSSVPTYITKMVKQRSFAHAVKWAYTANWGDRAFSALFTFILAAVLGPRDFGVVSIALIYVLFLQMFLDQGFVAALIQRKDLEQEHLDAVFWVDLALSGVLVALSILCSRWWAARNHAPDVAILISVLSLTIPIQGLSIVQTALLQREMDFKSLSIRSNASVFVSGIVGIIMAFTGFGVWSLVGQQLLKGIVALVLLWRFSPWRPRFEFSWKQFKELLGFSTSNFAAQLGIFADTQASSVLLGLFLGPVAVGLYRLAERLMGSVVAMATTSIQAVALPEFARFQDNPEELRKSVLSCIRLSSTVTLPALTGLAVVSGPLMATLGPQWIPASGVTKVLCGLGMAMIFAFFTGPLLQALSRPHQLAVLEWGRTALGIVLLFGAWLIVRHGSVTTQVMGIALARLATMSFVVTPLFVYILVRLSGVSLRSLAAAVFPSVASSVSVVFFVSLFRFSGLLANGKPSVLLAAEIAAGGIAGLVVLLSLDKHLRDSIWVMIQRNIPSPVRSQS